MELFTPDSGLVIWMFVAFVILFIVLRKWGWPVIIKMMESRADTIDKGVEDAKEARRQLDNARAEAEKFMAEARKQQAEILSDAQKMKTQIIDEAKVEASKEAQKVMDAAKVSIQQSQKEAELQLKMRKEMKSDKAHSELVNKLLDEYENN